jgi:hypothetical protein
VRVLRRKLLSAIFVVLPATAALTAHTVVLEAASGECRTKPGPTAPLGSRWVYRVNRVDHRRCWFVSSQGEGGHSNLGRTASGRHRKFVRHGTRDVLNVQYDRTEGPETASATDTMLPIEQASLPDFAARWPDLPSSQDLPRRKVATITYTRPANNASTSSTPFSGIERAGEQPSLGDAFNSVLLGGALTASLFVAGGISYVARQRRRRDERYRNAVEPHQRTVVAGHSGTLTGNKWPMQTRHHISGRQASPPIAPADDPEADLHDIALDLRWSIFGESLGRVRKITGL